jgi:hypothetical protein
MVACCLAPVERGPRSAFALPARRADGPKTALRSGSGACPAARAHAGPCPKALPGPLSPSPPHPRPRPAHLVDGAREPAHREFKAAPRRRRAAPRLGRALCGLCLDPVGAEGDAHLAALAALEVAPAGGGGARFGGARWARGRGARRSSRARRACLEQWATLASAPRRGAARQRLRARAARSHAWAQPVEGAPAAPRQAGGARPRPARGRARRAAALTGTPRRPARGRAACCGPRGRPLGWG